MNAALRLCTCFLIVAGTAAMECHGSKHCQSDVDSAILLQSKTVANAEGAVALPLDADAVSAVTVECSTKDQASCGSALDDDCTWSGFQCEMGCKHFDSEESCPDYCHWDTKDRGGDAVRCRSMLGGLNIGGKGAISQGRHVARPQLKTTEHYSTANGWQPCGGDDNCITGASTMYLNAKLNSPDYTATAVEILISCEHTGDLTVDLMRSNYPSSNAKVQVWYNLEAQDVSVFESDDARERIIKVPISSSDADPVLRVEVSRADGGTSTSASLTKMKIRIRPAVVVFDKCMTEKFKFAQCTNLIANTLLRSDHDGQVKCLEGTDTTADGCSEWSNCLAEHPESKDMIIKVSKAMSQGKAGLMQMESAVQAAETGTCKPGGHGQCVDPKVFDIEAFDCNCFDKIESMSQQALNDMACADTLVCCSWKANHCTGTYSASLAQLNTSGDEEQSSEGNASRHGKNIKERDSSLDETLNDKCAFS